MKLVIFGLTISSSWGNGHATLWRGLARALTQLGHDFVFFERDVPYYAIHRDLREIPGGELHLYPSWEAALPEARRAADEADAALVTSYCPDAIAATKLVCSSRARARIFYDLDTPVTLDRIRAGQEVEYVGPGGLAGFDRVLSFTGGAALRALEQTFGARRTATLYGSVDPAVHQPVPGRPEFRGHLSYLGTWAASRQQALEQLFLEPARRLPRRTFVVGGSLYPADFPWRENVFYVRHLPPAGHPAFYCSSPLTLNITRGPMAEMGWCPSGRLFEAAACGVPVLSDPWEGIESFFEPGKEILLASSADEVIEALQRPASELARIGAAARRRALADHTAARRAEQLLEQVEEAAALRSGAESAPRPEASAGRIEA